MRLDFHLSVAAGLTLALLGCTNTYLEPAATARRAPGIPDSVVGESGQIRITAQVDAWHGCVDLEDEVTPVRLVIENHGEEAVPIRYRDLALVAVDGSTYRAVPPRQLQGDVALRLYSFRDGIHDPANCEVLEPSEAYPRAAYEHDAYSQWMNVALPTPEMLRRALPEGMIPAHGQVEGFVYFPQMHEADDTPVDLVARLNDAKVRLRFTTPR